MRSWTNTDPFTVILVTLDCPCGKWSWVCWRSMIWWYQSNRILPDYLDQNMLLNQYIPVCTEYALVHTSMYLVHQNPSEDTDFFHIGDVGLWEMKLDVLKEYMVVPKQTNTGWLPRRVHVVQPAWANLQWGIVAYERGWYPETEPSVLQHQMALRLLLLRFSVTDHGDCHFREESLEKVTVVTSKRRKELSNLKSSNTRFTEFTE